MSELQPKLCAERKNRKLVDLSHTLNVNYLTREN